MDIPLCLCYNALSYQMSGLSYFPPEQSSHACWTHSERDNPETIIDTAQGNYIHSNALLSQ